MIVGLGLFLNSVIGYATTDTKNFQKELEALVTESQKSSEQCKDYRKKVEELVAKATEDKSGYYFKDQNDLAAAISLLQKIPATPSATHQAFEKILMESQPDLDPAWFPKTVASLESCLGSSLGFIELLPIITGSIKNPAIDSAKQTQVRDTLISWIKQESLRPTPLGSILIQIGTLNNANKDGFLKLNSEQDNDLKRLAEESQSRMRSINTQVKGWRKNKPSDQEHAVLLMKEIQLSETLRQKLHTLVEQIK